MSCVHTNTHRWSDNLERVAEVLADHLLALTHKDNEEEGGDQKERDPSEIQEVMETTFVWLDVVVVSQVGLSPPPSLSQSLTACVCGQSEIDEVIVTMYVWLDVVVVSVGGRCACK